MQDHLYLLHSAVVEEVIRTVSYRHHLRSPDREDFAGGVRLRLLEDDCAVLRKFEGRSAIKTYLTAVIVHLFQDWRNARWGKWRASADARRAGPLAVHLEQLTIRDGLTLDEAYETLSTNYGVTASREELSRLAARLPARTGRHLVGDDGLLDLPSPGEGPEDRLLGQAAEQRRAELRAAVAAAMATLDPQDQLILKMRFGDGITLADVARTLRLDQKHLYRRVDKLLAELRRVLTASGFSHAESLIFSDRADSGGGSPKSVRLGRPSSEDATDRRNPPWVL